MMTFFAIVGTVLGTLGTVLGVYNAFRQATADRVRLTVRVAPKVLVQQGVGMVGRRIAFRVVNLSAFALTVDGVGFELRDEGRIFVVLDPELPDRLPFPRRLEPREAVTLYIDDSPNRRQELRTAARAYVTTACGYRGVGPASDVAFLVDGGPDLDA